MSASANKRLVCFSVRVKRFTAIETYIGQWLLYLQGKPQYVPNRTTYIDIAGQLFYYVGVDSTGITATQLMDMGKNFYERYVLSRRRT